MLGRLSCQVPGAPGAPKSFDLCRLQAASPNGSVSVGRGGGVDVACDAPRGDFRVVSKAHAQLKLLADGHLQVTDVSSNGTFFSLPGELAVQQALPQQPVRLPSGSILYFGGDELLYQQDGAKQPNPWVYLYSAPPPEWQQLLQAAGIARRPCAPRQAASAAAPPPSAERRRPLQDLQPSNQPAASQPSSQQPPKRQCSEGRKAAPARTTPAAPQTQAPGATPGRALPTPAAATAQARASASGAALPTAAVADASTGAPAAAANAGGSADCPPCSSSAAPRPAVECPSSALHQQLQQAQEAGGQGQQQEHLQGQGEQLCRAPSPEAAPPPGSQPSAACSICMDLMVDPRVLPCPCYYHACAPCLDQHFRADSKCRCPNCRQTPAGPPAPATELQERIDARLLSSSQPEAWLQRVQQWQEVRGVAEAEWAQLLAAAHQQAAAQGAASAPLQQPVAATFVAGGRTFRRARVAAAASRRAEPPRQLEVSSGSSRLRGRSSGGGAAAGRAQATGGRQQSVASLWAGVTSAQPPQRWRGAQRPGGRQLQQPSTPAWHLGSHFS